MQWGKANSLVQEGRARSYIVSKLAVEISRVRNSIISEPDQSHNKPFKALRSRKPSLIIFLHHPHKAITTLPTINSNHTLGNLVANLDFPHYLTLRLHVAS